MVRWRLTSQAAVTADPLHLMPTWLGTQDKATSQPRLKSNISHTAVLSVDEWYLRTVQNELCSGSLYIVETAVTKVKYSLECFTQRDIVKSEQKGCSWYKSRSESNASYLFPWELQQIQIDTIVSNALKLIVSSVHSSLVIIRQFARMSWSRCPSFCGVTAVHGHPECGLSFTLLSPLLKRATHRLTVLTSTVWSL